MNKLPFGKNYQLMIVVVLILGFIMAMDKDPYGFGFMNYT
jgi:hypothetical protein